jgi:hypothetical protein|uniref:Uncharacterized protein n=1 Tax=Picea glauca TaxID=3330 RepID=A0A101LXW2_PICGL|nr:hypothetical protein ABT39_MTgene5559 [Picea glauca]QHR88389.1 hypothetical protein Q903MT_gene2402 [Picea sitchensis]
MDDQYQIELTRSPLSFSVLVPVQDLPSPLAFGEVPVLVQMLASA